MNNFEVTFDDGDKLTTGMNADLQGAKNYYLGQSFVAHECEDKKTCCGRGEILHTAIKVVQLPSLRDNVDLARLPKNAAVIDCGNHWQYEDSEGKRFVISWEGRYSSQSQAELRRLTKKTIERQKKLKG